MMTFTVGNCQPGIQQEPVYEKLAFSKQAAKFLMKTPNFDKILMAKNSGCSFLYVSFLYAGSYCISHFIDQTEQHS